MMKIYTTGTEFYEENQDFLLTNVHTEVFFRLDAPLLKEINKEEYAIALEEAGRRLVILSKEPFNQMLYGDKALVPMLYDYLLENGYRIKDYLTPIELGDAILTYLNQKGLDYKRSIGMDFMEAKESKYESSSEVEAATKEDIDEVYSMTVSFVSECGLKDEVFMDRIANTITDYRIIRKNGEIAAMAKLCKSSVENRKISYVYTKPKYRGLSLAKKICINLLNEILAMGLYATLNVDQKNPISYHIYSSIGFYKIFSQGIYVKED